MRSLGDFLAHLDAAGELERVEAEVSPILEISEIAHRQARMACPAVSEHARAFDPDHCELGGKALLFENVAGCDFPLAINVFGSYRRMEMALRCVDGGFASIASQIAELTTPKPPSSIGEALGAIKTFAPILKAPPKRVKRGACQEVVRLTERGEVDLTRIPLIKCWPLDGDPDAVGFGIDAARARTAGGDGRYVTFAGIHTIHADDRDAERPASHNIGMYRAQLIDETHLAMHWHIHHDGAAHWRSWKRIGEPMPIAICFGGAAVMPYAATAPLPPGLSELLMAGFLNGRGIRLVPAKTVPLRVPADSEIVIEGYVSTEAGEIGFDPRTGESLGPGAVFEGPFGDHTGFYSLPDRYPLVDVTAVTHRRDAVFPATIVGLPPQEDYYLGKATERIFLPLLQTIVHDIVDYHLPMFGCFHYCAFIKIEKAYPLQARRVMHAIWGAGQMAWTKIIVVVDESVDVHDERAVLAAIAEHVDPRRDLECTRGPLDILDHASAYLGAGGKLGIDATRRWPGEAAGGIEVTEPFAARRPDDVALQLGGCIGTAGITDLAVPDWGRGRWTFVAVEKDAPGAGPVAFDAIWNSADEGTADIAVVVDATVDVHDREAVLFHLCANVDPSRDLVFDGPRLGIDATAKVPGDERNGEPVRDWPPIIEMSDEIKTLVEERWGEYFA